ncbi:hypothetical protein GC207_15125 [bacterium]|nr:hypothetical protein [bacterium]
MNWNTALAESGLLFLAAGGWCYQRLCAVGVRWYRVQSAVAGVYHQQVTGPAVLWQALGCPPQLRPRLPWWQPLAWHWLA